MNSLKELFRVQRSSAAAILIRRRPWLAFGLMIGSLVGCYGCATSSDPAEQRGALGNSGGYTAPTKATVDDHDLNDQVAGVNKLTDQAALVKLALEDKSDLVRMAAVAKLTDQTLVAKVAVEDDRPIVRTIAVSILKDQLALETIAGSQWGASADDVLESQIRVIAACAILDPAALEKIADLWDSRTKNPKNAHDIHVVMLGHRIRLVLRLRLAIQTLGIENRTGPLHVRLRVDETPPARSYEGGGNRVTALGEGVTISISKHKLNVTRHWVTELPHSIVQPENGSDVIFLPAPVDLQQLLDDLSRASQ